MFSKKAIDSCQSIDSISDSNENVHVGAECSATLDMAFFFDGMGRDVKKDISQNNLSNAAKLFQIFPDNKNASGSKKYSKSYFSGLGASFDGELVEGVRGASDRSIDEVSAGIEGQGNGSTLAAGKETISNDSKKSWYEVFGKTWANSFTDWKGWLKEIRNGAIKAGAEIFAPIRDNWIVANVLMSGAPTRLSAAMTRFENATADATGSGGLPVRTVRISVFGCDFGAAMAKRFVHDLLSKKCNESGTRFFYGEVEVIVSFVGLFDCVDRTHSEMGPLDWLHPLTPVLDDGGSLHPGVKSAFHLIAAHERRFYRRSRTIGSLHSGWEEALFPGISEDVGGGIAGGTQKLSTELSTVSLHRMYNRAFRAGVPFPHIDDLPSVDMRMANSFAFDDVVGNHTMLGLARYYEEYSKKHLLPSEDSFYYHTALRVAWQAHHYVQYQAAKAAFEQAESAVPSWVKEQAGRLIEAITDGACTDWDQVAGNREQTGKALETLEDQWGWLNDIEDEANHLIARFESYDRAIARHARLSLKRECALAYHWRDWTRSENPPHIPDEILMLFSFGLHDKLPEKMDYRINQQTGLFHGYRFFTWRGLDKAVS